jgi:hypothetical protein
MDLAFDDMYVYVYTLNIVVLGLNRGRVHFLYFVGAPMIV